MTKHDAEPMSVSKRLDPELAIYDNHKRRLRREAESDRP